MDFGGSLSGSHEVLTLKHRLVRFLIEELEFTHIIMEVGWVDGFLLDRYVRGISGDTLEAQRVLMRSGENYHEVLEMIAWLRDHNLNVSREFPVRIIGVGWQDPVVAMDLVAAYFDRVDPDQALQVKDAYQCLRSFQDDWVRYGVAGPEQVRRCRQKVQQVEAKLQASSQEYISRSSVEAYEAARHASAMVTWAEKKLASLLFYELNAVRNEDIQWILDHTDKYGKMIVWAPNIEAMIGDSGLTYNFQSNLSARSGGINRGAPIYFGIFVW